MVKFFKKGRSNPPEIEKNEFEGIMAEGEKKSTGRGSGRIKIDLLIHDLKVPLSVIEAGAVSLLNRAEKYGPLTERQEKVLARILRNTKVTQALVNDALELGRLREGKVTPNSVPISRLIKDALTEVFDLVHSSTSEQMKSCDDLSQLTSTLEEQGLNLDVDTIVWQSQICLDEAKIRQILRNLLNNALKYKKNLVKIEVKIEDGFLVLSVTDDGEGIPAIFHKKIFECYFQLPAEDTCTVRGHGLGLAGVMVLVEDLGGELTLNSDTGRGATFNVRVPIMREGSA